MTILLAGCNQEFAFIFNILHFLYKAIVLIIPIVLIVLVIIDVFKVVVNERDGYTINSFKTKTFVIQKNTSVNPSWIDNIPPVITNFKVENLGYYNSSLGARAGWNIRIYIEGYDTGSGINKYQTWLVPYQNGSGAEREDGNNRVLTNVLYLNKPEGRTFCAYVIDNAGNESEKCETIKI